MVFARCPPVINRKYIQIRYIYRPIYNTNTPILTKPLNECIIEVNIHVFAGANKHYFWHWYNLRWLEQANQLFLKICGATWLQWHPMMAKVSQVSNNSKHIIQATKYTKQRNTKDTHYGLFCERPKGQWFRKRCHVMASLHEHTT